MCALFSKVNAIKVSVGETGGWLISKTNVKNGG